MKLFSIFNFKLKRLMNSLKRDGVDIDSMRIEELRESHIDPVQYCECLQVVVERSLPLSLELFDQRVDSGKNFESPLVALAKLQDGSRQFSWEFLCDLEDAGVGAEQFVDTYFSQLVPTVEKERIESLLEMSNHYALHFYKGVLFHIESRYTEAAECFEIAGCTCTEPEVIYYHAESLYRAHENLSPEIVVTLMNIVHTEPTLIYRLADLFLVEQDKWLKENSAAVDTLLQYLLPVSTGDSVPGDLKKQIGSLYRLRKAWRNALEWFSKVSEEDQEDQFMWYECYLCYKELGDSENAESALENVQVGFYDPEEVIACFEE